MQASWRLAPPHMDRARCAYYFCAAAVRLVVSEITNMSFWRYCGDSTASSLESSTPSKVIFGSGYFQEASQRSSQACSTISRVRIYKDGWTSQEFNADRRPSRLGCPGLCQ